MTHKRAIALTLAIMMIVPLYYTFYMSGWFVETTIKTKFSNKQRDRICQAFMFDLGPEETLAAQYFPGFLQATTGVTVTIDNLVSQDDFLARFRGEILEEVKPMSSSHGTITAAYAIKLFAFDQPPKDYHCELRFGEDQGRAFCKIVSVGYFEQLEDIYRFLDNPWQPVLANPFFMVCAGIEFLLVAYLTTQSVIGRVRKRRQSAAA